MFLIVPAIIALVIIIAHFVLEQQYRRMESAVLDDLGFEDWDIVHYADECVIVKSRQALEKYDDIKFFKENRAKLDYAQNILRRKKAVAAILAKFLENNEYQSQMQYARLLKQINTVLNCTSFYRIKVKYITYAGNHLDSRIISISQHRLNTLREDPSLLMSKGEYSKYQKEQYKEALTQKHHEYYEKVNDIIDYANEHKNSFVVRGSQEVLDNLVGQLFDRTVNGIKKIKSIDSEEWDVIGNYIGNQRKEIEEVISQNLKILSYYESPEFLKIKHSCETLMSSQREFNEYISEKVSSISKLFGTRVIRDETINDDEYNYIRPYKKTITPFTAEVSSAVFASAENAPLEYVVKNFYPNKTQYPQQIQRLYLLIEELETLKDAKKIIENYKLEYQQYLGDVPNFVMENDEAGFYSKLGFANIDVSVLVVEYKFSYTSGGGMAHRFFTVPMTEETIVELIRLLESKLTASAFAKEQRYLMTNKLRESIKSRDNFTCCTCGNSVYAEPNLLLEIDHIIPVSKGGCTVEENLQTLCWKCNRSKSNKIIV